MINISLQQNKVKQIMLYKANPSYNIYRLYECYNIVSLHVPI